ncbi:unnamed protein product [Sphagnum balticum]
MVRQPGGMESPGNTSELHAIPEVTPFSSSSSSSSSSAFAITLTFGRRIVARVLAMGGLVETLDLGNLTLGKVLLCAVMGVLGGLLLASLHAVFEYSWFHFLDYLDRKGVIQRLAPSIPVTMINYKQESFWAVAVGPMPLFAFVFAGRSSFSFDFLGGFLFTWTVMVLHDAYFFTVHTLMHKFKLVYRRIHQWHHVTNGDLTVYSTAFGDVLDIAFTFTPFYACLLLYVFLQPSWDLLHMLMLGWAVYCVNMMGHSGYKLPAWIYVPASSGVLLTPYAQRPRHHYIHHLDPRYNRSLYFTWCDRLTGTFREHHPKVLDDDESSCDNKSLNINNNNNNYKSKKSSDDNIDHCKDLKSLMMDPIATNFTFTELLLPSALSLKFYRGNHHA